MSEEGTLDIKTLTKTLSGKLQKESSKNFIPAQSFIKFCEERAEVRKYGRSVDSCERYDRFLRWFKQWGVIQTFSDITDENILQMDGELVRKGMKPYSKWNNYHRFLNSFILDAKEAGYVKRNPYKWLNIAKEKSSGGLGKYLSPEEFRRISEVQPPTRELERARDVFIFQTWTCLSYVDLAAFDAGKLQRLNGRYVYVGKRGKTNQEFTFLLLKPAERILRKYNNHLPIVNNAKYNDNLKILAVMAGVDKPVSSHWARHTGATLLLNEGHMDMEVVAKVLGHSSTKITRQVYAKLLDETVVNAMSAMELKL
jgi:site-specific recombinase XerD